MPSSLRLKTETFPFLPIMMPNMDGHELVKCLREYRQNVPVIFLTAKSAFEDKRKGFAVQTSIPAGRLQSELSLWMPQATQSAGVKKRLNFPKRSLNYSSNSFRIPIFILSGIYGSFHSLFHQKPSTSARMGIAIDAPSLETQIADAFAACSIHFFSGSPCAIP